MFLILATGTALLLGSLLSYAVAMALILHVAVSLFRRGYRGRSFWRNVAVMMIVTLIMAGAPLAQIALWARTLVLCGTLTDVDSAFYPPAENYTALGLRDIGPP